MHRLWVVIAFLVAAHGTARADLSSQLYGDVRDVIEELIQTEVTTSVVTTVKTKSPALEFYMHGTLERLGSPYWGSLGRVLKDDVTVVTADFVYWHVSTGGGSGDIVASAKTFFNCARKNQGADPAWGAAVAQLFDVGLDRYPQRDPHEQDEQRGREAKQQGEAGHDAQHHEVRQQDAASVPIRERHARGGHLFDDGVGECARH